MSHSVSDFLRYSKSPYSLWAYKVNKLVEKKEINEEYSIPLMESKLLSKHLEQKAIDHEISLKDYYRFEKKLEVTDLSYGDRTFDRTKTLIQQQKPVIYQGYISSDEFSGIPDFLVFDEEEKAYYIVDAKLSKEVKEYQKLQIACYADILHKALGYSPKKNFLYLVEGDFVEVDLEEISSDYQEYKSKFLHFINSFDHTKPPYPTKGEEFEEFEESARIVWEEASGIELINGIWAKHVDELKNNNVHTLQDLVSLEVKKMDNISENILKKYKRLSNALLKSKDGEIFVAINEDSSSELLNLQEPLQGDMYIDFEGYPYMDNFETFIYMYGFYWVDSSNTKFDYFWADHFEDEMKSFRRFVEFLISHDKQYPNSKIYYYNHYETTHLKKLSEKYNLFKEELEEIIERKFVDLLKIIRSSFTFGLSSNSLKSIEKILDIERTEEVQTGSDSMKYFEEYYFESKVDSKEFIVEYNKQDCKNLSILHHWLQEKKTTYTS